MANLRSGLRSGPHNGMWMWFALIQGLINFLCVPAECLGADNIPMTIYPKGTVLIKYGDPLDIICVDETSSSSDLYFTVDNNIIPSQVVNTTTRRLYIEKPEKSLTTYFCRDNKSESNNQCYSRVLVDSPPVNVTDFSCRSYNLERLNCSWSSPISGDSYTDYNLTFFIYGQRVQPCKVVRVDLTRYHYCIWDTDSQPRYSQMEKQYLFDLTSCNPFGCITQCITVDHFSIVKPEPPTNLVSVSNDTHSVLLQWRIHKNMALTDGVEHKIEYQIAKIDNMTYFRSVDASSLPAKNKTYRFLLSNLPYAHMPYEVRIYIKCISATNEGIWSDFAYKIIYTASERPKRPPDTIVGAFRQELYKTKRMIYIYWKQLEKYEEAGTNFTYKIVAASPYKKNSHTLIADVNKSLSYVVFENATFDAIDVSIWSMNDMGLSNYSSYLYIPPEADTRPKVTSFTKLAYINGTYKLLWGGVQNIDNYTVFWCIHNTTGICAGRMDFTVVDPNRTTYMLDLPKQNRYQFAISANSGKKTSGMVWAVCEISEDSIELYRFPIKMDRDAPGPSYVNIKWSMDCTPQEGAINGYQISYCPVLDTSSDCATKNVTTINITEPKQMEKNITNLEPYTTYLFTLAMNTPSGLKTLDNASIGATTIEDTPTTPVNITVSDIEYNSLNISWDPPIHKNGVIGKYVIKNYGKEMFTYIVSNEDKDVIRRHVKLTQLTGFTNYSLTVQACNNAIRSCSKINPNDAIFVRTRIGPPGKLKSPTVKSRPDNVTWEPLKNSAEIKHYYQLKRVKDGSGYYEIFNTTKLSFALVHCDDGPGETYSVRAVNCDDDVHYGAWTNRTEVKLPYRNATSPLEHPGEWSDTSAIACGGKDGLMMTFILMAVFALMGLMYSSVKCYKKYRKMEDIKPVLPNGLGVPEKDISKYPFGAWNPSNKDEKPSSDEMLLLPNSRTTVSTTELKQKENDNCASSDHTDSTALSNTSRAPAGRQISNSGDSSDSSLHLEAVRDQDKNTNKEYEDLSSSDTEASQDPSPYFDGQAFQIKSASGYVPQPVSGYIQSAPMIVKSPPANSAVQNPSSSYVMASLSTPIFTTGVPQPSARDHAPVSAEYVRPEDTQLKFGLNFPKLGPLPTKMIGPESLPTMPTLPTPTKLGADSSYIQLQSLDTLPSHKQPVRNTVPLKPQTSSGYVSPGDAVINKHFNNMLSGGQLAEDSAILDPTMSPDAYCRFSWSTDPANDNLHSLLADSPRVNSSNK